MVNIMPVSLNCVKCNSDFKVKPSHASRIKFCCRQCYLDYTKEHSKKVLTCQFCKKEFKTEPYKATRLKQKFCSSQCAFNHKSMVAGEFDDLIKYLYEQEWSIYEIGAIIHKSGTAVQGRLKEMKIKRRTASELRNGRFNPTRGVGHSDKTKQKLREASILHFSDPKNRERQAILTSKQIEQGKTGKFNNNLEKQMKILLESLEICYQQCFRISRKVYDFKLLDYPILIETDGTFWHADPRFYNQSNLTAIQAKNKQNDLFKNDLALNNNFILIRIWEYDIVNHFQDVKNDLLLLLKQTHLSSQVDNCFLRISVFSNK